VIFSLEKVSNLSEIAFLSIAVKNIVSLATLDNSKFFWRTSHAVVSAAGWSAANLTLVLQWVAQCPWLALQCIFWPFSPCITWFCNLVFFLWIWCLFMMKSSTFHHNRVATQLYCHVTVVYWIVFQEVLPMLLLKHMPNIQGCSAYKRGMEPRYHTKWQGRLHQIVRMKWAFAYKNFHTTLDLPVWLRAAVACKRRSLVAEVWWRNRSS